MLVTRSHFSPEFPINGSTPRSKNSLGLLLLPLGIKPIVIVEPLAPHLHELYDHNIMQITISNYNYQFIAEFHKRLQKVTKCDEVLIRVHSERFPLENLKRLLV